MGNLTRRGNKVLPEINYNVRLRDISMFGGDEKELRDLVQERGVDVNQKFFFGDTALHLASSDGGNNSIVQTLLELGANPNKQNNRGLTPLHYAFKNPDPLISGLLLDKGADPSIRDNKGRVPIFFSRKK